MLFKGIWKPGEDIPMVCCDRLASRDLLCVGTEYGHIRLFAYPCSDNKVSWGIEIQKILSFNFGDGEIFLSVLCALNIFPTWRCCVRDTVQLIR